MAEILVRFVRPRQCAQRRPARPARDPGARELPPRWTSEHTYWARRRTSRSSRSAGGVRGGGGSRAEGMVPAMRGRSSSTWRMENASIHRECSPSCCLQTAARARAGESRAQQENPTGYPGPLRCRACRRSRGDRARPRVFEKLVPLSSKADTVRPELRRRKRSWRAELGGGAYNRHAKKEDVLPVSVRGLITTKCRGGPAAAGEFNASGRGCVTRRTTFTPSNRGAHPMSCSSDWQLPALVGRGRVPRAPVHMAERHAVLTDDGDHTVPTAARG